MRIVELNFSRNEVRGPLVENDYEYFDSYFPSGPCDLSLAATPHYRNLPSRKMDEKK